MILKLNSQFWNKIKSKTIPGVWIGLVGIGNDNWGVVVLELVVVVLVVVVVVVVVGGRRGRGRGGVEVEFVGCEVALFCLMTLADKLVFGLLEALRLFWYKKDLNR